VILVTDIETDIETNPTVEVDAGEEEEQYVVAGAGCFATTSNGCRRVTHALPTKPPPPPRPWSTTSSSGHLPSDVYYSSLDVSAKAVVMGKTGGASGERNRPAVTHPTCKKNRPSSGGASCERNIPAVTRTCKRNRAIFIKSKYDISCNTHVKRAGAVCGLLFVGVPMIGFFSLAVLGFHVSKEVGLIC